jgi:hypothetical protein
VGLNYICATAERFFAVGAVLGNMVVMLAEQPSPRLLKHIIRCYLRLSDNPRYVDATMGTLQQYAQGADCTAIVCRPHSCLMLSIMQVRCGDELYVVDRGGFASAKS